MPITARLVLTPKGQTKLANVINAALGSSRAGVVLLTTEARRRATQFAPSPGEEAEILSRGVAHDVIRGGGGGIVGTKEDGRFLKQGADVWLQDAIATDPIEIQDQGLRIYGRTGRPSRINSRASFHWSTRRRGMQGPTFPFNRALVESFEYGGVWIVDPRPGGHALEPEDNLITRLMTKTIPPRQMYFRAAATVSISDRPRFIRMVRDAVRRSGLV